LDWMTRAARLFPFLAVALSAQVPLQFQGRNVVLTEGATDASGTLAPASVCVEWEEQAQCYRTPQGYGRSPDATVVPISKDQKALLFSVATSGASDYGIHFALLTKGSGRELQDLFFSTIEASNQSAHALWTEPSLSDSQIFILADYVWGPGESTHEPHRYLISAYVRKLTAAFDTPHYYLQDRYMTARKYDPQKKQDILATERPEILARLARIK
jgi:hypothetical protein